MSLADMEVARLFYLHRVAMDSFPCSCVDARVLRDPSTGTYVMILGENSLLGDSCDSDASDVYSRFVRAYEAVQTSRFGTLGSSNKLQVLVAFEDAPGTRYGFLTGGASMLSSMYKGAVFRNGVVAPLASSGILFVSADHRPHDLLSAVPSLQYGDYGVSSSEDKGADYADVARKLIPRFNQFRNEMVRRRETMFPQFAAVVGSMTYDREPLMSAGQAKSAIQRMSADMFDIGALGHSVFSPDGRRCGVVAFVVGSERSASLARRLVLCGLVPQGPGGGTDPTPSVMAEWLSSKYQSVAAGAGVSLSVPPKPTEPSAAKLREIINDDDFFRQVRTFMNIGVPVKPSAPSYVILQNMNTGAPAAGAPAAGAPATAGAPAPAGKPKLRLPVKRAISFGFTLNEQKDKVRLVRSGPTRTEPPAPVAPSSSPTRPKSPPTIMF